MDAKLVENLIKALHYENHIYSGLLNSAEKKTEYLVKNDTASLSEITKEENLMADQAGQLGKVREQYISKICEALGVKAVKTVDEIRKYLPKGQSDLLGSMQDKLRETVMKLVVRNGINQKLIENALNYIDFNIQLLTSPAPQAPTYGKTGQDAAAGVNRSLLDVRY